MKIKEFFKPTILKIVLTIIIFVILLIPISIFDRCLGGRVCPEGKVNYHAPFTCQYTPECISASQAVSLNLIQKGPVYLMSLIISYILSSLITKLFNKNKK